ncbi:MAG TPA: AmmeMemoRadiSam system protein B [Burkholderiales bacterium]|nr:AmmeMemoRadiSam system protein B [Burkholderiales bacterium]
MSQTRAAAVAGTFYPGEQTTLARELLGMLDETRDAPLVPGFPKALIVPHAGYIYSGHVAAHAYALLRPAMGVVKRVVLLGPCHRVAVCGLALPEATAFETPLGRVEIDEAAVAELKDLPQVSVNAATHAHEHSLEVQVPFLQQVLKGFKLVPLVVGQATREQVAGVLDRLWGGPETLIVISSDLSHYHPYNTARAIDRKTVQAIMGFRTDIDHVQACGATPVTGFLETAKRRGMTPELLDARNSGDTAGGRDRVVGYASFAFWDKRAGYEEAHGRTLLGLARTSVASALKLGSEPAIPDARWLMERRATFVTLMQEAKLRGCIGSLQPTRALGDDVVANAAAAALADRRFAPLGRDDLARVEMEVSLLSVPTAVLFGDDRELVATLRPGVDGVILASGDRRGTYLPQVWEQLPDPRQFLASLMQKAGIPADTRLTRCQVWRYQVRKWKESELRVPQ